MQLRPGAPDLRVSVLPVLVVVGSCLLWFEVSLRMGSGAAVKIPAVALGMLVVAAGAQAPGLMACVAVVLVPLQVALLSWLYAVGLPGGLVRGLGFVKEAAVAALVLAAVRSPRPSRERVLRALVASYVGVVTLFLVLPFVAHGVLYDIPTAARVQGWREDCLGLVALLALAVIDLGPRWRSRFVACILAAGTVMGAGAVWEFLQPEVFQRFVTGTLQVARYRADVLHANAVDLFVGSLAEGRQSIRAGSFLFSPLDASFYLLVPFGLLAARLAARPRLGEGVAFGIVSAGLLTTQTRSSVAAASLAALLLLATSRGRSRARVLVLGGVLVALLVSTVGGAVVHRLQEARQGTDYSSQAHASRTREALAAVRADPLGRGLGTSPSIGARFGVAGALTTENAYLQVGVETGLVGMALFAGSLLTSVLWGLRRRGDPLCLGMGLAGSALLVSGLFLHTWQDFAVSLSYWSLVGVCLAAEPAATAVSTSRWPATVASQEKRPA